MVLPACLPFRFSVRIGKLVSHDSRDCVFPAVLSALSKERDGGAHVVGGGRRRCEGPHCEALLVRGGSGRQRGEHGETAVERRKDGELTRGCRRPTPFAVALKGR